MTLVLRIGEHKGGAEGREGGGHWAKPKSPGMAHSGLDPGVEPFALSTLPQAALGG